MSDITIISLNVKGLQSDQKRRDIFNYLRNKKSSIIFLQETHSSEKDEKRWTAEWGHKCFFSHGNTNSAGVMILFQNNFEYSVNNIIRDKSGRYIVMDITVEHYHLSIVNLYGPNSDSPLFFTNLKKHLENLPGSVIMAGDWNVVQDYTLDTYNYKQKNNILSHKCIAEIKHYLDLNDPWRMLNPEKRQYTWRLKNLSKQSRLDYFLVSEDILALVKTSTIGISYKSDHSIISLQISFTNLKRGPGYWKFNANLLYDDNYTKLVRTVIKQTIDEYYIAGDNNENIVYSINDQLLFEIIKMRIRSESIKYSANRKNEMLKHEKNIEKQILKLESRSHSLTSDEAKTLHERKLELETLRNQKIKGIIFRSRAKWYEEGEKNTEYFLKLEKRNYINKNMSEIFDNNNVLQTDNSKILKINAAFFKKLYSNNYNKESKEVINNFLDTEVKLSEPDKEGCEGPLSLDECTLVLKMMKNGKGPGSDGFTTEFYKFFWKDIGSLVCHSINFAYNSGRLSDFQRQGLITCIPKDGRDRRHLKNWRPITLLNVDYKIASSVIANRMKLVLPNVISESQAGFLKGRFIGETTRIIYDVLDYCNTNNIPGLLLTIDFEKAFDTIDWDFIDKTLQSFNFGQSLRKWVKLFFNDSSSANLNFGYLSDFFKCERGCRQWDPISPYLFILCVELLSLAVKRNENIKGIKINNVEYCIFQYADDTNFTLDGSQRTLLELLKTIKEFEACSGLKMNMDKCTATWIGSKTGSNERLCAHIPLPWSKEPYKILGIMFSTDLNEMPSLNFEKQLIKARKILFTWSNRSLTINGKIIIIKSQILPLFTNLFTTLPDPDKLFFQKLNTMFYKFIWYGKQDKIKRSMLMNDYKNGGLKKIDPKSFCRYLSHMDKTTSIFKWFMAKSYKNYSH